jgi:tetratricopeptide (TPR) repeat protein
LIGRALPLVLLALVTVGVGCAAQKRQETVDRAVMDFYSGDYDAAREKLEPLAARTDEDFVINNLRLGSTLLPAYALDDAEAAFLRAWEVINSTGVNAGGRTLGAVLVDEKIKVWKGEPFERAMASFYLGLIYYIRQDYGNARGAFENALFKLRDIDPDNEKDSREVESNFSLASLMLAKSFQRLGREDLARANFDYVTKHHPQLAPLADFDWNENSNLLLVVDYGYGPRKVTDFDGAIAGFGPTPAEEGPIAPPRVLIDGRPIDVSNIARPPVDLLALAQDRKWQSVDTIRTVKSAVGTGLLLGGAVTGMDAANNRSGARQRDNLIVAGALIGTGLLLKATSQADVRQWEMLPRTTFVIPLKVEPGSHDVTIEFPSHYYRVASAPPAGGTTQTWRNLIVPPHGSRGSPGEATYYFRMQRWSCGPFDWPPPGEVPTPQ